MHSKVWDEATHPNPNLNDCTVEVLDGGIIMSQTL